MPLDILRRTVLVAFFPALISCAGPDPAKIEEEGNREQQTFSVEDKRIARALSIGGDELIDSQEPVYKAMLCSMALEAIEVKMEGSGLLNAEQQELFAGTRRIYASRAEEGLSTAETGDIRRRIELQYPDASDRARFAVGCLREFT